MKIKVVIDENHEPGVATLTVAQLDDEVKRIIEEFDHKTISATYRGSEFPLNINDVIFFQTDAEVVTAHLTHRAYQTRYRLYELEELLPHKFVRISKSAIVNIDHIASITRTLSTTREITFHDTHKINYVSRRYYSLLKEKMEERTL